MNTITEAESIIRHCNSKLSQLYRYKHKMKVGDVIYDPTFKYDGDIEKEMAEWLEFRNVYEKQIMDTVVSLKNKFKNN